MSDAEKKVQAESSAHDTLPAPSPEGTEAAEASRAYLEGMLAQTPPPLPEEWDGEETEIRPTFLAEEPVSRISSLPPTS